MHGLLTGHTKRQSRPLQLTMSVILLTYLYPGYAGNAVAGQATLVCPWHSDAATSHALRSQRQAPGNWVGSAEPDLGA